MNIVATIRGTNPELQDVLILGSHMVDYLLLLNIDFAQDSINAAGPSENWEFQRAPGADDDGSGTTVFFLSIVFACMSCCMDSQFS